MVRKRVIAVAIILIVIGSVAGGVFAFDRIWGSGTVKVSAMFENPSCSAYGGNPAPWNVNGYVDADVFEGDKKIGRTNEDIHLSFGKHILSFGEYDSEHETPQNIEVNIPMFGVQYVSIKYISKFGALEISATMHDKTTDKLIYETGLPIYVNGISHVSDWAGNTHVYMKIDSSNLGSYRISFPPIAGYETPEEREVIVEKGKLTQVSVRYENILSNDEELNPTPSVTNIPTPILTAPTSYATSGPTITIYWTAQNPEKIYYAEGHSVTPSPGYVYLMVNMTIENNGYDRCDTSPAWFTIIAGNYGKYGVDIMLTSYVGHWSTNNIPNGYSFSGVLVFQIPSSSSVPSIEYNYIVGSSTRANVRWINVG